MYSFYSQHGTIIRAFQDNPNTRIRISFFQNNPYKVGYKAPTRISELIKKGYLERSFFDHIGEDGKRYAQYIMTTNGYDVEIIPPTFMEKLYRFFK